MKTVKRIVFILVITILIPATMSSLSNIYRLSVTVSASETEVKIENSSFTIGIASTPKFIYLRNTVDGNSYTFISDNKKIATVFSEDEFNGVCKITGVAKGNTLIIVKENNIIIGKVEVEVVGAKLKDKVIETGINSFYIPIKLDYINSKAKYKYKSSNTSVAIVKYSDVLGIKYGRVIVTVTETIDGKETKVGSITVNVGKSKLVLKKMEIPVMDETSVQIPIVGYNNKAKYYYKSADNSIVTVDKSGCVIGLKEGSTSITISETYMKKTRNLGSINVKVVSASVETTSEDELILNYPYPPGCFCLIRNINSKATYTFELSDNSILTIETLPRDEYHEKYIKALAPGAATITVYEEYNGVRKAIGSVNVKAVEAPVKNFTYDYEFEIISGSPIRTYYLGMDNINDTLRGDFITEPYISSTPITYVSSDETVLTIDKDGYIAVLKEGIVTITVSCGEFSYDIQAIGTRYTGE